MFADTQIGIRELRGEQREEMGGSACSGDIKKRKSEKCGLKSFEEDLHEQKPEEPATKPRKRSKEVRVTPRCLPVGSKAALLHGERGSGAFLQVLSPLLIRSFTCNMA